MKVTINRNVLFDYLKSMIRIVPQTHSQMGLRGFLVECNEDDGFMYITASNIETSIGRRKFCCKRTDVLEYYRPYER